MHASRPRPAPTNRFTFNFPIKFAGTQPVPSFRFLMACVVAILSRTFLRACAVPSSWNSPRRPLLGSCCTPSPRGSWPHQLLVSAQSGRKGRGVSLENSLGVPTGAKEMGLGGRQQGGLGE